MCFGLCLGSLLFHFAVKHPKRIAINATTPKASKDVKMEPAALDMGNDWYEKQLMGLVWWVWWCCCKFESIRFSCPGASFTSASTFAVTLDAASPSSCLESLRGWWLTTGFKIGGIYIFIKLQNMAIKRNELKHKCRVVVFRYITTRLLLWVSTTNAKERWCQAANHWAI